MPHWPILPHSTLYQETKDRIATYMSMSESRRIEVVWKRECDSGYCSVIRKAEQTLAEYGMEVTLNEKGVTINGESMTAPWRNLLEETEGRIDERNE